MSIDLEALDRRHIIVQALSTPPLADPAGQMEHCSDSRVGSYMYMYGTSVSVTVVVELLKNHHQPIYKSEHSSEAPNQQTRSSSTQHLTTVLLECIFTVSHDGSQKNEND
jgi:hypothetical protein